ncbi:carboxyl transferase domain-containing protein [Nocardia terpenica]|uniref:biotin carboxylase n=1 Tax=Nocardia terpenica TaxID=455432 RepID=A0A164NI44_9NOCA|nr:carboxyl transferase domain-containing protein [Nocardia terpenica]KZM74392.1 fused acetyl/propionyl-CoA carboxylase subuit alpha/methylmalonyl-CoA decarboxylase subunit alpha [Nocardia terpenica]NQE93011.1 ATP-grasp domain-containing protein [Nocardia terpenica]
MFTRIAIVNRGEAARRLIHAVREFNAEHRNREPLRTIALYTDGERHASFVREADDGYCLGPASARPYLDPVVLERALVATRADAAWAGWGFVAEDPAFVELCDRLGVTFIGPSAAAMRALGDKIGAKLLAEQVGVPVAPWSRGPVDTLEDALAQADAIGYPLMLKATAGGGGRGIRIVASPDELREAYTRTSEEAARAFGSGVVFLERLVTGGRHIEVQVIADAHGTAWALGVRDCTVQRRNQKIIEESASPLLSPEQIAEVKDSAERLAVAVGYCGAATVEFLYQPQERLFAFLEVNTRLQVEHPVTELTCGIDLVRAQLQVASGQPLTGERPIERGHAVEARLNAEDADRDFAPAPGRIELLRWPAGPGVRIDTGVVEGDEIPPDFDSMIAKIIAYGRDRAEALARLRRAVAETTVVIEGGATNKSLLMSLLEAPEVIDATADTRWVDRARAAGGLAAAQQSGIALAAAAIAGYEEDEQVRRTRLWETGRGGRPQALDEPVRAVEVKLSGRTHRVTAARIGASAYRIGVDDTAFDATVERRDRYSSRLTVGERTYRIITAVHGTVHLVEVDGVAHRVSRDEGGAVRAPAPALVVATPVAEGAEIAAGAPVLVLESMKMETVLPAPFDGRVRKLLVSVGSQVATGTLLAQLEPIGEAAEAAPAEPVDLKLPDAGAEETAAARASRAWRELSSAVLGFDHTEAADPALPRYLRDRGGLVAETGIPVVEEAALLESFCDIAELSAPQPEESSHRSRHEQLHTYLHSLDVNRGALSAGFRQALSGALRRYGVQGVDRTPELEQAVYRIVLACRRFDDSAKAVQELLKVWLGEPRPEEPGVRASLERLTAVIGTRVPLLADLARSVVFRWYVQPEAEAVRTAMLAEVPGELRAIAEMPESPERTRRITAIAEIPESLDEIVVARLSRDELAPVDPLLDVLLYRHYGQQQLGQVRDHTIAGRAFAVADYRLELRPRYTVPTVSVSTVGRISDLREGSGGELVTALRELLDATPADHVPVMDLLLAWPDAPASVEERSAALLEALQNTGLAEHARRITIALAPPDGGPLEHLTFRRRAAGLVEDTVIRGVHPLIGRRLHLWRLRNFHLERLVAPPDMLLYHTVAKDNSADQRLVVLAQVRRFEPVRDGEGAITAVRGAETVLTACTEALSRARRELDPAGTRLDLNHVWLDIRPLIDVDPAQLADWLHATAPQIVRAGIEEVLVHGSVRRPDGSREFQVTRFRYDLTGGTQVTVDSPPAEPLAPLDDYDQKVLRVRRRGAVYPYELTELVRGPGGTFTELDLEGDALVAVDRPRGHNSAGIVVGLVSTPTELYPEGVRRIALFGDPYKALGALAEPECARIIAALEEARRQRIPVEWYAVSAGARISMDSGTENMDWVARALRSIVQFTQDGGEINIIVAGINVGAQPYWNAEATMLMHTKGILIMTPAGAMVLTGKQSLDFSGGVSAEDNFGIGGYARVMGPNAQAQYYAPNLAAAHDILLNHYAHTYVAPGEPGPRRAATTDPVSRDVTVFPHHHPDSDFTTVGDIFSATANPDRKKPFSIRPVLRAVSDQDHLLIERWADMAEAETAVVTDARIDGRPVCLIGIESGPVARHGFPPADGPESFTAGTLFPLSSKKVARAINAASGNRPVVVLANLSGFDGSPESMRRLQLEYGAEIGRAIVNFEGPVVFCVISRYHGGAFVVFSKALNPNMTVLAVEGSFASVIGGAPAAAVVFARTVDARTADDPRIKRLEQSIAASDDAEKRAELATELAELRTSVRAEQISALAAEFDQVHSIERAVRVGSVDAVIAASELRPRIAAVIESALS